MKLVNKIPVLLALALTVNGMAFIHPASVRAAKTVSFSTKKLAAKAGQSEDPKLKRNKKAAAARKKVTRKEGKAEKTATGYGLTEEGVDNEISNASGDIREMKFKYKTANDTLLQYITKDGKTVKILNNNVLYSCCLLYTSDAADEIDGV